LVHLHISYLYCAKAKTNMFPWASHVLSLRLKGKWSIRQTYRFHSTSSVLSFLAGISPALQFGIIFTHIFTTGIRAFAECRRLCRVIFIGHSAKQTLPSTALGNVLRSVKSWFTECRTLGTTKHSAKTALPSVKHSANMALSKGPLAAVYNWRPSVFAECQISGTQQTVSLPSVLCRHSAKHIFIFYFGYQTFCGMFLHYVDQHVPFWDNYNSVFYS
jgi:hypothetical protein